MTWPAFVLLLAFVLKLHLATSVNGELFKRTFVNEADWDSLVSSEGAWSNVSLIACAGIFNRKFSDYDIFKWEKDIKSCEIGRMKHKKADGPMREVGSGLTTAYMPQCPNAKDLDKASESTCYKPRFVEGIHLKLWDGTLEDLNTQVAPWEDFFTANARCEVYDESDGLRKWNIWPSLLDTPE